MYGMVNRSMEDMVVGQHGEEMWERIKARAGVDVDVFISNDGYPDSITYDLVGAASVELGVAADVILVAFGEHWVMHTALGNYGDMMRAGGRTLREFLLNLPMFHTRVSLMFPDLKPPIFECSHQQERSLHLHYRSARAGLDHFVVGLVRGLGQMFQETVTIDVVANRSRGDDHDVFLVRW
jgi:hypothetical protein